MDKAMHRRPGRPSLFEVGAKQHLAVMAHTKARLDDSIAQFERDVSTHRIVIALCAMGMHVDAVAEALHKHPDSDRWRTRRQVVHIVERARRELETFIMDADRNGAGIKEALVEAYKNRPV